MHLVASVCLFTAKSNKIPYQVFVCVSVIRGCMRIIAQIWSIGFWFRKELDLASSRHRADPPMRPLDHLLHLLNGPSSCSCVISDYSTEYRLSIVIVFACLFVVSTFGQFYHFLAFCWIVLVLVGSLWPWKGHKHTNLSQQLFRCHRSQGSRICTKIKYKLYNGLLSEAGR